MTDLLMNDREMPPTPSHPAPRPGGDSTDRIRAGLAHAAGVLAEQHIPAARVEVNPGMRGWHFDPRTWTWQPTLTTIEITAPRGDPEQGSDAFLRWCELLDPFRIRVKYRRGCDVCLSAGASLDGFDWKIHGGLWSVRLPDVDVQWYHGNGRRGSGEGFISVVDLRTAYASLGLIEATEMATR